MFQRPYLPNRPVWRFFLFLSLFIWGCGLVHAREMRTALVEECPTTNFPKDPQFRTESGGAILSGLLGSLAGTLVETGVQAFKRKVNPENEDIGAKALIEGLYVFTSKEDGATKGEVGLAPKLGCLVVAVGDFSETVGAPTTAASFPFKTERDSDVASKLLKDAIGTSSFPKRALYFEATLRISADRTALTWQPVRFFVEEYLNDSFFAGRSRGMQINMLLYKPGAEKPFYSQEFPFDSVRKPVNRGPSELYQRDSGTWGLLPASPEKLPVGLTPTTTGRPFSPFTLDIKLVESPKPYKLAQAFAAAVEATQAPLKQEVLGLLDNDAKRRAELASDAPTIEAVSKYLTAFKEAKKACSASDAASSEGKFACRIALDSAAAARLSADLTCSAARIKSCDEMPALKDAGGS